MSEESSSSSSEEELVLFDKYAASPNAPSKSQKKEVVESSAPFSHATPHGSDNFIFEAEKLGAQNRRWKKRTFSVDWPTDPLALSYFKKRTGAAGGETATGMTADGRPLEYRGEIPLQGALLNLCSVGGGHHQHCSTIEPLHPASSSKRGTNRRVYHVRFETEQHMNHCMQTLWQRLKHHVFHSGFGEDFVDIQLHQLTRTHGITPSIVRMAVFEGNSREPYCQPFVSSRAEALSSSDNHNPNDNPTLQFTSSRSARMRFPADTRRRFRLLVDLYDAYDEYVASIRCTLPMRAFKQPLCCAYKDAACWGILCVSMSGSVGTRDRGGVVSAGLSSLSLPSAPIVSTASSYSSSGVSTERLWDIGRASFELYYHPPCGPARGLLTIRKLFVVELETKSDRPSIFVHFRVEDQQVRTGVAKKSSNTNWSSFNNAFALKRPGSVLNVSVRREVQGGKSDVVLGYFSVDLSTVVQDFDLPMVVAIKQKPEKHLLSPKKLQSFGVCPGIRPIILIPGLGATRLRVEKGSADWEGRVIWLSVKRLLIGGFDEETKEEMSRLRSQQTQNFLDKGDFAKAKAKAGADVQEEIVFDRKWVKHMKDYSQLSDPPIRVSAIRGIPGIDYLWRGSNFQKKLTNSFGALIEHLMEAGFREEEHLFGMGFDWRLGLGQLESTTGYYTQLKRCLETARRSHPQGAVVVSHSFGNRVFGYFTRWLARELGSEQLARRWCDTHVHSWIGVSPPFAGSPKTLKAITLGDRFGLDFAMSVREALSMARSWTGLQCLLPDTQTLGTEFEGGSGKRAFFVHEGRPLDVDQVLALRHIKRYTDDLCCDVEPCPPLRRFVLVRGSQLDTEMSFKTRINGEGKLVLDDNDAQEAIRYGPGDGTVPRASMQIPMSNRWADHLQLEDVEFPGVEHSAILYDASFHNLVLSVATQKK